MTYSKTKTKISDHERPRLIHVWMMRLFLQIGYICSWTVIMAIFISSFGIAYLPYLLLVSAVLFLLGSTLSNFVFLQVRSDQFLIGMSFMVLWCIFLAYIYRDNQMVFFISAVLGQALFYPQLFIGIIRKTESLFSPSEAQRMMPIIESSVTIGTIIGSGIVLQLLHFFSTKDVLFFWSIPVMGIMVLAFASRYILHEIPNFHLEDDEKETPHRKHAFHEAFHALKKVPFVQFTALFIFAQAALFTLADFEFLRYAESHSSHEEVYFSAEAQEHSSLPAEALSGNLFSIIGTTLGKTGNSLTEDIFAYESLAHHLGIISLILGIVALFVEFVLTSKILEKIGVINTMFLYFGGFLAMVGTLISGATNMNFVRGFQHGFHALFETPYHMSFYSIFSHSRESVRHFLEGVIRPFGILLGVSLIFLFGMFLSYEALSYAMGGLLLCIMGLFFILKKKYTHLSTENLQSDQNISAKLHSIEVLTQNGHKDSAVILAEELLRKDVPEIVREKIISATIILKDPKVIHSYLEILSDIHENANIKNLVLEALLSFKSLKGYWEDHAISFHHLLNILHKYYETKKNPYVRKLIIMNFFAHLPPQEVAPFLQKLLQEPDDELKSICLRSCQIFDDQEIVFYIRKFIYDKNPRLRGHAVISLWKFGNKELLRKIIHDLIDSEDVESKIAGIYAVGEVQDEKSEDKIHEYLDSQNCKLRMHSLIAMAKLGDRECLPGLLELLFGDDIQVANSTYRMLSRVPDEIQSALKSEINMEVSKKILRVLVPRKITRKKHLINLSSETTEYLKRLYRLAEKYDEIFIIENARGEDQVRKEFERLFRQKVVEEKKTMKRMESY